MWLDHNLHVVHAQRDIADRAIHDRLQPIVADLQRRADANAQAARADAREQLLKSPHCKAVRDAARVSLDAMREAQDARSHVAHDRKLSDATKAERLDELGADLDRSLSTSAKTVAASVAKLRAAAPQSGFLSERPLGVTSDLALRWAAFPHKLRSGEVEDGVKTLQTAMDPSTPAQARANALWTLDGYHLPAMWRTARAPEENAKSMSSIAGDLGSAIRTHLNVALGHVANQETMDAANSLARDYNWLSYQRDGALDDAIVELVAASLFPVCG